VGRDTPLVVALLEYEKNPPVDFLAGVGCLVGPDAYARVPSE